MAGFTEGALAKKLAELNNSQQSIQTLSLWLIHHRKHHATIVKVWFRELTNAKEERKLTFMYLANDVIQNSKKKGPEFGKEFGTTLKRAFEHMGGVNADEKTKRGLTRLLNIWEERGVYDQKKIKEFKKAFGAGEQPSASRLRIQYIPRSGSRVKEDIESIFTDTTGPEPVKKKVKVERVIEEKPKEKVKVRELLRERKKSETEVEVEVDGMKELHVTLSPRTPAGDPPEPEELIKALLDLENSASSDAVVRERIASLPPDVSEVTLLSQLQDKASADRLAVQVSDALQLLTDYNGRLSAEMDDRKKVTGMLRDFLQAQKELLTQAEETYEEYTEKLQKIYQVRQELKSHIQNLPDLTMLPNVTGGLAPLPSAGDLFNLN